VNGDERQELRHLRNRKRRRRLLADAAYASEGRREALRAIVAAADRPRLRSVDQARGLKEVKPPSRAPHLQQVGGRAAALSVDP
jgi:hypothetical protein